MGNGRARAAPHTRAMRGLGATLLAVLLAGCALPPATTKPADALAAAIAAEGASVKASDRPDAHFELLLARLDLASSYGAQADAIAAQLRSSRAAVAEAATAKSSAAGGRLARVSAAGPTSIFSVPLFAKTLAGALDELTKQGGSRTVPGKAYEKTEAGAGTRTTTSLRTTETFTGSGSVVKYEMQWTYRSTTVDSSGQPLVDVIDERLMVGTIDVCPDANGSAPASLDAKAAVGATKIVNGAGQQVHSGSTSTNRFSGRVDDSATLRSVKQDFTEKASWQTASGSGSYDSNISVGHNAGADGGFIGGFDASTYSGSISGSGDLTGVDVSKATAWTLTIDGWAMEEPFQSAQKLWRNGRCVVVQAPDYGAETPIATSEQSKPQHDERVDVGSETRFSARLKHRYQGALDQPVAASLTSGGKSLEPGRLASVPSSLTYKAPDEEDKKATATLKSTSKRGIGTLVLDFHTGGDSLTLTVTGELSTTLSSVAGVGRRLDHVTVGPIEFTKLRENLYEGKGRWSARLSSTVGAGLGTMTCEGSEGGDVEMLARLEKRGAESVWVIDSREAVAEGSGTETCTHSLGGTTLRGVTLPTTVNTASTGASAGVFLGTLRPFTLPAAGGRTTVTGSIDGVGGIGVTASGTAEGRPTKR